MTGGEHREPEVRTLLFGFDLQHLYLRLDLGGPAGQRLTQGLRCSVSFTTPADYRLVILGTALAPAQSFRNAARTEPGRLSPAPRPKVAAGEILEAAIPFADLGLRPNTPFAFFVTVHTGSIELERHPAHRPISSIVPEATFEELNWKA